MAPRWQKTDEPPEGLIYIAGFLTSGEEADLAGEADRLTFQEVRMQGVVAKRTTAHFGWGYDYDSWRIRPVDPIPKFLLPLRSRCAEVAAVLPEALAEALVTRYPEGAGIGWHRDARSFGGTVIGVSLLSPCRMRFRLEDGERRVTCDQLLERRSLYVLSGPARWKWQHSIPSTEALRYSITFRVLRTRAER